MNDDGALGWLRLSAAWRSTASAFGSACVGYSRIDASRVQRSSFSPSGMNSRQRSTRVLALRGLHELASVEGHRARVGERVERERGQRGEREGEGGGQAQQGVQRPRNKTTTAPPPPACCGASQ